MSSRQNSRSGHGGGFGALAGLLALAFIVTFIWWILGAIALVGLFFLVRAVVLQFRKQADANARRHAAIAARADQQHHWVLHGDDRGIYGTEGAEIMHQLRRIDSAR
ncbi:hypothetical protein [Mycobacterium gastri]|uniref:Uncharacterized protein n=1 Tax=Mycobacterium gastri TaxID=1777 RepID=A0A1X1VGG4_MYCGS|nr:hypothetical protein [Mycobacterium gastri]ETW23463.1 hypothetical protein MGAST_13990 [Mycobacterium gastri 'Wayne']ORV68136.1 hypothetical protein AWC07_08810 [Mycobacterium gastri]